MVFVDESGIKCIILNGPNHNMKLIEDHAISGIIVPKGFVFDGASHIDESNNVKCAALIHDYMYREVNAHNHSRKYVDDLFLQTMKSYGVPKYTRIKVYIGVRLFGWYIWNVYRHK